MYIVQQIGFSFLYIIGSILIATMLGIWFSKSKVTLPRNAKFLFGCALTPFFVGSYLLIFTVLPFRLPNVLYLVPIYFGAISYIFVNREYVIGGLNKVEVPKWFRDYYNAVGDIGILFLMHVIVIQTCDGVNDIMRFLNAFLAIYFVYVLFIHSKGKDKTVKTSVVFFKTLEFLVVLYIPVLSGELFPKNTIIKLGVLCSSILLICIIKGKDFRKAKNTGISCLLYKYSTYYAVTCFFLSCNMCFRNVKSIIIGTSLLCLVAILLLKTIICLGKVSITEWMHSEIIIIVYSSIFMLLYSILTQLTVPISGADASEYLSNALEFVRSMRFESINSYAGDLEGRLVAIIHHPNYVLYLGFALLHSMTGAMGFPYDFATRIAFSFNILYFIAALWGISFMFKGKFCRVTCLIMPFACHTLSVIFDASSRDGYRMIPIIVFVGLLMGIANEEKITRDNYIVVFFCTACIMMGHPINVVQALVIVIAYICWCILVHRLDIHLVFLTLAGGVGAVLGAAQLVFAYCETGRFTGDLINLNELLQNTAYYNNYMEYSIQRLAGCESFWDRIIVILSRDYGVVMIPGLIAMILYLIIGIRRSSYNEGKIFLAIVILIQTITILDIFGWSGFSLTEWYVKNARYSLHMFVFSGILLGIFISDLVTEYKENIIIYSVLGVMVMIPFLVINARWTKGDFYDEMEAVNIYSIANEVIDDLEDGQELMIDNYYCNYYLGNQATSFFTNDCREIREAQTFDELEKALESNGVGAVLINHSFINVYWKDSLLLDYLLNDDNIQYSVSNEGLTVYCLK